VHGVATLEGGRLTNTPSPVKRSVKVQVLETLWPQNSQVTNTFIVDRYVWTHWPDSWWNYNSRTGVYFFIRTAAAVQLARERERLRPTGLTIRDNFYGTNKWMPLDRYDDWYEPDTNLANIEALIVTRKGGIPKALAPVPPKVTRYDFEPTLRSNYLASYQQGYSDAWGRTEKLPVFSPSNDADKARVLGYAEGMVAGQAAQSNWFGTNSLRTQGTNSVSTSTTRSTRWPYPNRPVGD